MRRALAPPLFLRSPFSKPFPFYLSTASCPPPQNPSASLTEKELAEVHRLVPRLCDAGRHADAVRLLDACLLASPPLAALPIPALVDRLASHPDLTPTMALLTALKHHPRRPSPLPFCSPLLSVFFEKRRPKEAAKVFSWLCRPDSPCRPDPEVYRITIRGFCRLGRMAEALRAVKEMVGDGVSPGADLREAVYRGMLREARIDEARKLDAALKCIEEEGNGFGGAVEVLDRLLREWEE
ncbi:uncharacterized protein [Elaeis guineensis]|uniref:Pentatricopeptide repeat-containing protein At1g62670, mitochondrial-like n=1 Tax=Elaeis guineensis var. tenera TaxID=51953 RepID=A0A6I9SD20_ELAGV|nr:pentatricopeptide repeat-containing protein At1g62670, mitochondrial-like [Elaeis guineensis]